MKEGSRSHWGHVVLAATWLSVVPFTTGQASTNTWAVNNGGNWSTLANWSPGSAYPNAVDDVAALTTNITANRTVTQDVAGVVTVGTLSFKTTSGTVYNWTVVSNGVAYQVGSGSALISNINSGASGNLIQSSNVLASPLIVAVQGGILTIAGPLSESGGAQSLAKEGANPLILSGTNAYSGATLINAGPLRAVDGTSLPAAGNLSFNGSGTVTNAVLESTGVFSRTVGAAAGNVQWTGHGGFSAAGGPLTVRLNGTTNAVVWGSGSFVPSTNVLAFESPWADNVATLENAIDLNGADRVFDVSDNIATNTDYARILGVIGNGSVTKVGAGTLVLATNNTYSGTTTVSGGCVQAVQSVGLPAASILQLRGGILESTGVFGRVLGTAAGNYNWGAGGGGFSAAGGPLTVDVNGNSSADSLVWGTTTNFVPAGAPLIFGSATANDRVTFIDNIDIGSAGVNREFQVNGGGLAEISGVISGGANNKLAKTGTGVLLLSGANTAFLGGIQAPNSSAGPGGTVAFTNANALGPGKVYWGYGAIMALSNASSSSLTVTNDMQANNGGGKLLYLLGGPLVMTGYMDFDGGGGGSLSIGPGMTSVWSGVNGTVALGLQGSGTLILMQTNNPGKGISTVSAPITVGIGRDHVFGTNTTLFNGNGETVYAEGGAHTVTNAVRYAAYSETHNFAGTNALTFGGAVTPYNNNAYAIFNILNTNALTTFSGPISGQLAPSGNGSDLTYRKAGPGTMVVSGTNDYNYRTQPDLGAWRADPGIGLPTNSFLMLNGGVLETKGTFDWALAAKPANGATATNKFRWLAGGGFSAFGAPLTVDINGGGADNLTWASTVNFVPNGSPLVFGSITANDKVTLIDNINLNSAVRTVQVDDNPVTSNDYAVLSGILSGGAGSGLNKTGNGTLFLNGANTYTGATTVVVGGIGGSGSLAGNLVLNAGTRFDAVIGNALTVSNLTIGAGCLLTTTNRGSGAVIFYTGTLSGSFSNLVTERRQNINYLSGRIELREQLGTVFVIH